MSFQQLQQRETREGKKLQPPLWLACVSLAYPVYWSMTFLQRAVPALASVAFFGHQLAFFECTFRGARAAAFASSASGFTPSLRGAEREPLLITLSLMAALIVLLSRMPRQRRPWYGFCLATAGWIGASPWLNRWTFSATLNAAGVLALVFFFAVQVIGLYWFVGWDTRFSLWLRLRHILAAWGFPMSALTMLMGQRFLWQPSVSQFCLGGLAAIIAAVASKTAARTEVSLAWPG